jgi:single-strand DNA-binding protein
MAGINKVILVGNVGKDPEVRSSASGTQFANFSLATSESWKDKETGEKQERTEWHNIVVIQSRERGLVDIVQQYVKKGMKLYVEGKIQTRKWEDKEGNTRYSTEIVANTIQMLTYADDKADRAAPARAASKPAAKPAETEDFDDDIPF